MVLGWLSDISLQPIFINCEGGRHRTGIFVAAYQAVVEKKPWDVIEKILYHHGWYDEWGHEVLFNSLMKYLEEKCPEQYAIVIDF